jgi:hypothetical protein
MGDGAVSDAQQFSSLLSPKFLLYTSAWNLGEPEGVKP